MAAISSNPLNSQLDLIRNLVVLHNPEVEINYMYSYGGDYVEFSIKKDGKRHEMKFTGTYLASTPAYNIAKQIQTTIGVGKANPKIMKTLKLKKPNSIETWADKWAEKQ